MIGRAMLAGTGRPCRLGGLGERCDLAVDRRHRAEKEGPVFDEQKFRELILYFAQKSADDPAFGAVKLNKLLFYADFVSFAKRGKAITGATYFRLPHGPAPRQLLPITKKMDRRDLVTESRDHFG